jgi:type VI protein secretion system component Hcp
MEAKMLKK